jgi:hypothetical protein
MPDRLEVIADVLNLRQGSTPDWNWETAQHTVHALGDAEPETLGYLAHPVRMTYLADHQAAEVASLRRRPEEWRVVEVRAVPLIGTGKEDPPCTGSTSEPESAP